MIGQISTAFEERTTEAYRSHALEEVRTEHAQYFQALEQHPYSMVGQSVPAIGREGMETLENIEHAKNWQEAVKSILVEEVKDRASKTMDEQKDFINTVHASIDLFKNNVDLIPGTKDFDVELANQFAEMATPYELRVEGKLQGYSIPVQPIIDQLRTRLQATRAQKPAEAAQNPAAGAAASTPAAPAAAAPAAEQRPQAGVQSKAGNSSEADDDFSVLFGTIGLPNLQI